MKIKWQIDPTTGDHHICFRHDEFYVVYKSAGGDWCAGCQPDTSPCITDDTFKYFPTWQQARKYCEQLEKAKVSK